jgi:hypothetical protein
MNSATIIDKNPDPLTGEPGAHPVGTGLGAASGGVAGAVVGAVAGPIGMAVGAAVGAIAGGLSGKSAAEAVNPSTEEVFWREQYRLEPYYVATRTYDDYAPAYRIGYGAYSRYSGKRFDEIELDLEREYLAARGVSTLGWSEARAATRAAWNRFERASAYEATHSSR